MPLASTHFNYIFGIRILPPSSMNIQDFSYYTNNGFIEGVPLYKNIANIFLNSNMTTYFVPFHKVIINRNLVGRNGWETFLNYMGIGASDTAILLTPSPITSSDIDTITVQNANRVYTVIPVVVVYVFLFGKLPDSPWGVIQEFNIKIQGTSLKKSTENKIKAMFNTSSGVPLAGDAKWRESDDPIKDIQDRQDALERILREFFIGTGYLEELRHRPMRENATSGEDMVVFKCGHEDP